MPPNREPMWYCHECESEMRPLMVPDPHCASCNGTFVEMVESPQDDPRAWRNRGLGDDGDFDDFAAQLRDILPGPTPSGGGGFTLSVNRSSSPGGNSRTVVFGRPGQTDIRPDRVMPLTEFLAETAGDRGGRTARDGRGGAPGERLMMNQILGMLLAQHSDRAGRGAPNPSANIFGMPQGLGGGRIGDYVIDEQALNQIMTALMENSNAHRPVAATEEVLRRLDREVLVEGSPLLEKDCAVCKDQFSLQTEDPDEQVVITLPCQHPFHSPCILPWLDQNGTCPTCRYQLVPQPGSTQNPNNNSGSGIGPSTSTTNPPQRTSSTIPEPAARSDSTGGGFFSQFFHSLAGGYQNTSSVPPSSDPVPGPLPGSWEPHPRPVPEPGYPQATQLEDRRGPLHGSSHTNSNRWVRRGGSTDERTPGGSGNSRRGNNRERGGRRDEDGRRSNHHWDQPELD